MRSKYFERIKWVLDFLIRLNKLLRIYYNISLFVSQQISLTQKKIISMNLPKYQPACANFQNEIRTMALKNNYVFSLDDENKGSQ